MDISKLFPGAFIKAADLGGKSCAITIASVGIEKVGDDEKPVLRFEGSQQGFVLNKTNAMLIGDMLGDDTTSWTGQRVELYPTKTQMGAKLVDCIRVRAVGEGEAFNGDIPTAL